MYFDPGARPDGGVEATPRKNVPVLQTQKTKIGLRKSRSRQRWQATRLQTLHGPRSRQTAQAQAEELQGNGNEENAGLPREEPRGRTALVLGELRQSLGESASTTRIGTAGERPRRGDGTARACCVEGAVQHAAGRLARFCAG